ncbi:MAG: histidine phosphatase family protein [Burkholderiales bacterium]|nr:histidine phosphatase family protein [Burkholderiales bacterium]
MKKLVLIRHGDYVDISLTNEGREQLKELGEKLKNKFSQFSFIILYSPTERTKESKEILERYLNCDTEEVEALRSSGGELNSKQVEEILKMIENKSDRDIVILVTHFEFTTDFPNIYGETKGFDIGYKRIGYGCMRIINIENGVEE